jgi:hypothetical protein
MAHRICAGVAFERHLTSDIEVGGVLPRTRKTILQLFVFVLYICRI